MRSRDSMDWVYKGKAFCELKLSTKKQIEETAVLYRFQDNESISRNNYFDGKMIWVLLRGEIHLVMRNEEGRRIVLLKITNANSQFVIPTECLSSFKYNTEIICCGQTEICFIPQKLSAEIYSESSIMQKWRAQCYIQSYARLLELINDLTFLPMKERLYKILEEYCAARQTDTVQVTHEQLADELATSREVVSRLLKKMEAENLIKVGRKSIQLLFTQNWECCKMSY